MVLNERLTCVRPLVRLQVGTFGVHLVAAGGVTTVYFSVLGSTGPGPRTLPPVPIVGWWPRRQGKIRPLRLDPVHRTETPMLAPMLGFQ